MKKCRHRHETDDVTCCPSCYEAEIAKLERAIDFDRARIISLRDELEMRKTERDIAWQQIAILQGEANEGGNT